MAAALAGVRVLRLFGHEATAIGRYAVLSEEQAVNERLEEQLSEEQAPEQHTKRLLEEQFPEE